MSDSLHIASISRGLLRLAVAAEQEQIGQELITISDQLASGKATPQQLSVLSSRFTTLSKRFFALATLALSLSIANPAQAEDTTKKTEMSQDSRVADNPAAWAKMKELWTSLAKAGKYPKTTSLRESLPVIRDWINSHQQYGGFEELKPSKEMFAKLQSLGAKLDATVFDNTPEIYSYILEVERSSCQGTGISNSGGPGSCWVK